MRYLDVSGVVYVQLVKWSETVKAFQYTSIPNPL